MATCNQGCDDREQADAVFCPSEDSCSPGYKPSCVMGIRLNLKYIDRTNENILTGRMKTNSKIPSPRSNVAATFRFLVVLIGIFPIMLWRQALIPIVWWWVRWMECWLQHQDFHKPCLRVKESQKNSMHTWHIVPCVFFCYVVFSCNNLNNEVFILLRHYLSKDAAYFAAKIRRKRRVTKLI